MTTRRRGGARAQAPRGSSTCCGRGAREDRAGEADIDGGGREEAHPTCRGPLAHERRSRTPRPPRRRRRRGPAVRRGRACSPTRCGGHRHLRVARRLPRSATNRRSSPRSGPAHRRFRRRTRVLQPARPRATCTTRRRGDPSSAARPRRGTWLRRPLRPRPPRRGPTPRRPRCRRRMRTASRARLQRTRAPRGAHSDTR